MKTYNAFISDLHEACKSKKEVQEEETEKIDEVLNPSEPIEKWIEDFIKSDNPKFDGKTKEERRKMALGAYYAAQKK